MKTFFLFGAVVLVLSGSVLLSAADSPLLSTPKAAPQPDQADLLVGLRKKGTYKGDDVYSARLISRQRVRASLSSRGITAYYRIQNDSQGLMGRPWSIFALGGAKSDSRFDVSYFSDKGRNVTAKMARGKYVLNIATDAETSLRQRIFPKTSVPASGSFEVKAKNRNTGSKDTAGVLARRS
ncbi:MAG: hypothetical protein KDN18_11600 [Verrucomicrobiae bacterium]|nr:hypothetical protein [Verrucomicrobiae bacterium]